MDLPSAPAMRTSAPAPEETRIFMPRDAYAEVRKALDHGVSSPSVNTCSVPYSETVSAYDVRPRMPSSSSSASSTEHWMSTPSAPNAAPTRQATALLGASPSTG